MSLTVSLFESNQSSCAESALKLTVSFTMSEKLNNAHCKLAFNMFCFRRLHKGILLGYLHVLESYGTGYGH